RTDSVSATDHTDTADRFAFSHGSHGNQGPILFQPRITRARTERLSFDFDFGRTFAIAMIAAAKIDERVKSCNTLSAAQWICKAFSYSPPWPRSC
ncbi:MAG: hypothetical protein DMF85_03880, partial [Acidobacteria bacterium]